MTKPTQGASFKRFRDQLMGVTGAQDSGPENPPTDHEEKVSQHGQKAARNATISHTRV